MNKYVKQFTGYLPMLMPLVLIAGVGFLLYKAYEAVFAPSVGQAAANTAYAAGTSDLTTTAASAVTGLAQLSASLAAQGQTTDSDSIGNANTMHTDMNCADVDHAGLITFIQELSLTDFQLAAVSYGQQELRNYQDSITHIFTTTWWEDSFSTLKCYGSLLFHLQTVLSSDELSSISNYTDTIC